jgi:DNA polymerase elongation subunit (family B)
MDIEEIIRKIVDDGNVEYMHKLSELLEDTLELIQEYDEDCYKKYEMELYKMAYGSNLSKEMAIDIVHNMKPQGQRWSIEETQKIQEQFGMNDINYIDFYTVMNQGFNDFNNLFKDNIEMYVTYTDDFINDVDGKPHKVFWYFT